MFLWKGVLKLCSKCTGDQPCRSAISIKLLCNFTEITLRHGWFPVNLLHFLRTYFPKSTSGGLLLFLPTQCIISFSQLAFAYLTWKPSKTVKSATRPKRTAILCKKYIQRFPKDSWGKNNIQISISLSFNSCVTKILGSSESIRDLIENFSYTKLFCENAFNPCNFQLFLVIVTLC